jgi:hypothetical protein
MATDEQVAELKSQMTPILGRELDDLVLHCSSLQSPILALIALLATPF